MSWPRNSGDDGSRSRPSREEFVARYRGSLSDATRRLGDTSAAQAIYGRYLARLGQEVSYATDALRTSTFDFTGHDG
jgi:hypothetical protein